MDSNLVDVLSGGDAPPDISAQPASQPTGLTSAPAQPPTPVAPLTPSPAPSADANAALTGVPLVGGQPSVWKAIVAGALAGLAGSAGAKHFGSGLAGGAAGVIEEKQRESENAQHQQQLQFESAQAADSHIRALYEARAADNANQDHKIAMQDYAANTQAYAKIFGDNPDIKISGNTESETHAQAQGGLTTLANQNGGLIPGVSTVSSPATSDKSTHDIAVWAKPTSQDLTSNPNGNLALVNEYRKLHNQPLLSANDWSTGGGTVPDEGPSAGLKMQAGIQKWQSQQVMQARQRLYEPVQSQDDQKDATTLANLMQERDGYAKRTDVNPDTLKQLDSQIAQFKSAIVNRNQTEADLANRKTLAEGPAKASVAAAQAVAENTGAAADAKINLKRREAAIDQAAKMGNPTDAGQLLADRMTTISELKSRGMTPDYVVKAVNAANAITMKRDGTPYNAQLEDNNAKIAGSEANQQFFGNVRSLAAPGGTLDQLKAAGSQISQNDWQILNSTKNWADLKTGKSGISAYAAKAVGVADDYSKTMGGSVGSDTSRALGLALVDPRMSPSQRDDSVEAIRQSVLSQADGRAGNNSFLRAAHADILPSKNGVQPQGSDFFKKFGGQAVR